MSEVRIKLYNSEEIRRFTVTTKTSFESFIKIVKEFFPKKFAENKTPVIQYEDEEGDFVTFSSQLEWAEVLKVENSLLRIRIPKKAQRKEEVEKVEKVKAPRRKCEKLDFQTKPGDCVVELNSDQVSNFLKTGEIKIDREPVHSNIICDGCEIQAFKGLRYQCKNCPDFDLCQNCYKTTFLKHFKGKHLFEEIKPTRKGHHCNFSKVVTHVIHDGFKKGLEKIEKAEKVEKEKKVEKVEKVVKIEPRKIEVKIEPTKKVETKVEIKKFENLVVPSAPKLAEVKVDEKFNVHYKILENMGFKDLERNSFLLTKYNGNLQKVVDHILSE